MYSSEQKKSTIRAFSLVELSIIIIILGLLISTITVGRDLVGASKVRNVINQINNYSSAISTFRLKYAALPGDISNPSRRGLGMKAGNNNGILEDSDRGYPNLADSEIVVFWEHLAKSGVISGDYDGDASNGAVSETFPETKVGGGLVVYGLEKERENYFHIGVSDSYNGRMRFSNVLVPEDAFSLDNKFDDGFPLRGRVVARSANCKSDPKSFSCANQPITTSNGGASIIAGTTCVYQVSGFQDVDEDEYDFETGSQECNLRIEVK